MSEKRFPLIFDEFETLNECWRDARLLTKQILSEKLSVASSQFNVASKFKRE